MPLIKPLTRVRILLGCKKSNLIFFLFFSILGNEAQVCFFIIQLLLLKPNEFRTRVNGLMRGMHPEHWVNGDFYSHHMDFHRKFPEKFIYDENPNPNSDSSSFHHLPTYFGNVCLRFIPVFDIVVHR